MTTCYIALGSNLGDRRFYIESAVKKVRTLCETRVRKVSSIIQTAACGGPVQGPFLNAVMEIETDLTPYQLLLELQKIESEFGRVRQVVNGPRTLDLDILAYGDIRINEPALCIPHPRMMERDFVMVPLKEIAPEFAGEMRKKITGHTSQVIKKIKTTKTRKTIKTVKRKISLKSKRVQRNKRK